ncbi:aldehyde dehydrogenase family protein, partial [Acinetobacter baumannii]|uniref:aldehyde dehydrogenase family protein n=1 Tax=Acinetobacter baumannii TaxID=470 RepID=UPI0020904813
AIGQARAEGATLLSGGQQLNIEGCSNFIQPTIFANVTADMRLSRDEVFGPVLAVSAFDTEEQAIQQANDSVYGLAASVGTETYIKSAFIQDGTITNAKIGSYIQSNNYVAGQTGWKLFFDGTFEINGIAPGQGRSMMTNRSLRFWDANNVKRLQLGDQTE